MSVRQIVEEGADKARAALQGGERARIIFILAATLGLDSADKATVSAVSEQLKQALSIENTQIGMLIAVVSFVGAVVTLPAGVLADRMHRKTILMVAVATWAVATIFSGLASSYLWLLVSRIFLGVVTAAAWPCIASLSGDLFPARERAKIYGMILSGELVGTAIGFFVSAGLSGFFNWHWAFYAMSLPSAVLVWAIWRYLPEPERGGQSWLSTGEGEEAEESEAQEIAGESDVEPEPELVEESERATESWVAAMRYCLEVPSYRLLVITSALVYFFFAAVRGFGMIFFTQHYGLSHGIATLMAGVIGAGALIGVLAGGYLSEALLGRGQLSARVVVPSVTLIAAVPFLGFGLSTGQVWLGILLLTVGAGILALAMAPIDAARLDVIRPLIWGRAEAGRSAVRYAFEGSAPLLFGVLSSAIGLSWAFLILLSSVLGAGLAAWPMRRTYAQDVATAAASKGR